MPRTLEEIQEDMDYAINNRERLSVIAREEKDKDWQAALYRTIDICNDRISALTKERKALSE